MITGSHNPPEFNGFKIVIGQDARSAASEIQELRAHHRGAATSTAGAGTVASADIVGPVPRR